MDTATAGIEMQMKEFTGGAGEKNAAHVFERIISFNYFMTLNSTPFNMGEQRYRET